MNETEAPVTEENPTTVAPGMQATLRYTLALEDGTVVETTEGFEPLTFTVGDGTLIEGLEAVVRGLAPGDRECLQIDPREGFGYPDVGNIHFVERDRFPDDVDPQPGLIVGFSVPNGEEVPGTILDIQGDQVRVDFNHPLAGHTLTFDVEVVAVEPAPEDA